MRSQFIWFGKARLTIDITAPVLLVLSKRAFSFLPCSQTYTREKKNRSGASNVQLRQNESRTIGFVDEGCGGGA
ncbi:hypothetical protein EDB89DRAFT_1977645 [Lactarius sanguifluus]|nr:hypothetical protein EDB89DRAFT_1977645 [Lactarius sanguifluus]